MELEAAQCKEPITNTDHSLTNIASTRAATFPIDTGDKKTRRL